MEDVAAAGGGAGGADAVCFFVLKLMLPLAVLPLAVLLLAVVG